MKLVKELPKSILYSMFLHIVPSTFLLKSSKKTLPVIVSLTSIPSRLSTLHLVIKSIFNQTQIPTKIVLWLHEDLKNRIPKRLKKLQPSIFEIMFSTLDCPHLKLVESLKLYPNSVIVTCDDDLIYRKSWLKNLYSEHLKYPKDIIAHGTYQIKLDAQREYLPYKEWRSKNELVNHKTIFPIGVLGILYPPNALNKTVFSKELFLELTPKADDLWFKAMALINGTVSRQSNKVPKAPIPIIGSQKIALKKDNISKNKNDLQWAALSKHFNLKQYF